VRVTEEAGMKRERENGRVEDSATAATAGIVNSVDQMLRLPLQMTGATWDFMMQGMRNLTRTGNPNPQDLGGDDLKYVVWSLIFTKPGFECVLEPQRCEVVNYAADASSFAAVKIAKFLEGARHGHVEKADSWHDPDYPPDFPRGETGKSKAASAAAERGWRIPPNDHKYIVFLHRVEWRLPKQEEVTRVEHVTIEHGTTRVA
jgi:hypothetical protein